MNRIIAQRDVYASSGLVALMLIVGIVLVWKMAALKKVLNTTTCSRTAHNITVAILIIGIFMIVAPSILLTINITGNAGKLKAVAPFENIVNVQIIVAVLAAITFALALYLASQLSQCKDAGGLDNTTWVAIVILLLGAVGAMGWRVYRDRQEAERLRFKFTASHIGGRLASMGKAAAQTTYGGLASASSGLLGGAVSGTSKLGKYTSSTGSDIVNTGLAGLGYGVGTAANYAARGAMALGGRIVDAL